jgi:hypothetical protein
MSAEDPIGSAVPPERPKDPTHFGGEGLYESKAETPETPGSGVDSLKVPLSEHVEGGTTESLAAEQGAQREQDAQNSMWEFAKRNHVPALLAVGGIVWLIGALVRRSTERW